MLDRVRTPEGLTARCSHALVSPRARLSLLVVLLGGAAASVLVWQPQRLLSAGWPGQVTGAPALALFSAAYGVCALAFVPRPVLNVAAGALFGTQAGLPGALGGTVIGAGLAFCLGRALGRDALRPLVRGRLATAADRQLSEHGFRSMLAARLFPGVPFAVANYTAAVSSMRLAPFLLATALGSVPNTAAYVIAGSQASTPTSPAFLVAMGFIAVTGLAAAAVAWWARAHGRARG